MPIDIITKENARFTKTNPGTYLNLFASTDYI